MKEITDNINELELLIVGDIILVQWDYYTMKHVTKWKEYVAYNIEEVKNNGEIICQIEDNHYFNLNKINKGSGALKVWLIKKYTSEDDFEYCEPLRYKR